MYKSNCKCTDEKRDVAVYCCSDWSSRDHREQKGRGIGEACKLCVMLNAINGECFEIPP